MVWNPGARRHTQAADRKAQRRDRANPQRARRYREALRRGYGYHQGVPRASRRGPESGSREVDEDRQGNRHTGGVIDGIQLKSGGGEMTTNVAYGGLDRKTLYITDSTKGNILAARM